MRPIRGHAPQLGGVYLVKPFADGLAIRPESLLARRARTDIEDNARVQNRALTFYGSLEFPHRSARSSGAR